MSPILYCFYYSVPLFTTPFTNSLNLLPSMTEYLFVVKSKSFLRIPASFAIATAVYKLSPVTILTLIPNYWQNLTASRTPSLIGSFIPTNVKNIKSF